MQGMAKSSAERGKAPPPTRAINIAAKQIALTTLDFTQGINSQGDTTHPLTEVSRNKVHTLKAKYVQRWQKRNVNFVKQQLPGLACCC